MLWRVLAVAVFGAGLAAGATLPAGRAAEAASPAPPPAGPAEPIRDTARPDAPPRLPMVPPETPGAQEPGPREVLRLVLAGVTGSHPVACELALMTLNGRGYGGPAERLDLEAAAPGGVPPRELAAWVARPPRDPALVPPLRAALQGPDACARRAAARLLARLRVAEAGAALLDGLRSRDPSVRGAAAFGLGLGEVAGSAEPLRGALADPDARVRAAAAWALGELEDRSSIPALVAVLDRDADGAVRQAAAWALGAIE